MAARFDALLDWGDEPFSFGNCLGSLAAVATARVRCPLESPVFARFSPF